MDSMEELVINASTSEESQLSGGRSTSGFSWLFPTSNKSPDAKTPRKKDGSSNRRSFGNSSSNNNNNINSSSSSNASGAVPAGHLPDEKFTVDRFAHDVEQAKMMRRAMDRRKQQQQQQQQQNQGNRELTESDVRLGLAGLDEAVTLRGMGRLQEALGVSELSIELLIKYLKSDPRSVNVPGLSRDSVGIKIQNALTMAEQIKADLQRNTKATTATHRQPQKQPQKQSLQLKSIVDQISNILDSANEDNVSIASLASRKKKSAAAAAKTATKTRPPARTTHYVTNKKNSSGNTTTTPSVKTRSNNASRPQKKNKARQAAPSPFANSNDPLVNTIKTELYIDPSKLHSTTWNDIAGLKDAKQALQEAAILPLMRPDLFSGLRKPRNILLYGPPGTGKTLLVKAVAHESSCVLFVCTASAMTSKWHGEGEKLLRTLFQVARAAAPSIVFVDEVDSLLSSRKSDGEHEASRRFKTEFMTNMDGIVKNGGGGGGEDESNGKHLLVIAATNCPWDIDSAVLRRFPRRIYVPLPDSSTRKALLQNLLVKAGNTALSKDDVKAVVKRLSGFSGSDIASIASEASFGPIRSLGGIDAIQNARSSDIRPIQRQDFDSAVNQATKSVSKSLLQQYDQWKQDQAAA